MGRRIVILMLGGAKRVSIGRMICEECRKLGLEPKLISYELTEHEPIAEIGSVAVGLRWSDPGVDGDIVRVLRDHGAGPNREHDSVCALIPFVDGAIEVAGRIAAKHEWIYAPVSSPERSHALFDKADSAVLFEKCGLPIPATYAPGALKFPLIAKPRLGSASKGIKIAYSAEDLNGTDTDRYLLQEYIEHPKEYTVDCFVSRDGDILCISPRLRVATTGGEVTRTITVADAELTSLSRKTLKALDLRGAVTLQFLRNQSGRTMLMEINPRLGGGAVCTVHAGGNIPQMIVAEAAGQKPKAPDSIQPSIEIARYFQEVVFRNDSK